MSSWWRSEISEQKWVSNVTSEAPPPLAGGGWGEGAVRAAPPPPPNPLPQGEGEIVMNIAVTGGLGRLGRYVVAALAPPHGPRARHRPATVPGGRPRPPRPPRRLPRHRGRRPPRRHRQILGDRRCGHHAGERHGHLERVRGRPTARRPPRRPLLQQFRATGVDQTIPPCRPPTCRSTKRTRRARPMPTASASSAANASPKHSPAAAWKSSSSAPASSPSRNRRTS